MSSREQCVGGAALVCRTDVKLVTGGLWQPQLLWRCCSSQPAAALCLGVLCSGLRHGCDGGERGLSGQGRCWRKSASRCFLQPFRLADGGCDRAGCHGEDSLGCVLEGWVLPLFLQPAAALAAREGDAAAKQGRCAAPRLQAQQEAFGSDAPSQLLATSCGSCWSWRAQGQMGRALGRQGVPVACLE